MDSESPKKTGSSKRRRRSRPHQGSGFLSQIFGQLNVARDALAPELDGQDSRGRQLKMILGTLTAVALILLGMSIYLNPTAKPPGEARQGDPMIEIDALMRDGSPKELVRQARRMNRGFTRLQLPEQISTLKQQLEIINRLLKMEGADEEYLQEGVILKINTLTLLTTLNYQHDLKESWVEAELTRYASQHLNSTNQKIMIQARLALAFAYVQTYVIAPTEVNFQNMRRPPNRVRSSVEP